MVLYVGTAQIPQRFMTVNGLSPLAAAIRLLSFGAFIPADTAVAGALMGKPSVPPAWIVLIGAVLQVIGTIFLSRTSASFRIETAQYGCQLVVGTGVGFVNAGLVLLVPYAMEKRDLGKVLFKAFECSETNIHQPLDPPRHLSSERWVGSLELQSLQPCRPHTCAPTFMALSPQKWQRCYCRGLKRSISCPRPRPRLSEGFLEKPTICNLNSLLVLQ